MKNFGVLEYLSYAMYAILMIYFILVPVRALKDRKKCRSGRQGIIPVIVVAAVNAMLLILYDMSVFGGLSGHLVSAVGLALMPVFLSGLSDRTVHVAARVSCPVALAVVTILVFRKYVPLILLHAGLWVLPLMSIVSAAMVIGYSVFSHPGDMSSPPFVHLTSVRINMLYFMAFITIVMAGAYIGPGSGMLSMIFSCLCLAMLLLLFSAMYGRLVDSRIFFFCRGYERRLMETPESSCDTVCDDMSAEDRGYHDIFERLRRLFEEEKPFLDPDVSVSDISRSLFTNKAYLSRTINIYTGRNFRQFVNYHRIRYAVNLFHAHPDMKLADLAERSGFRTVNSFSMAFRLYMNMNPGEWCRKFKHNTNNADRK